MILDNGEHWTLEGFQAEIVEDIFSGVSECWVVIPEGSAKTTLMSAIGVYHADFTPSANCLVAAASREQAETLFSQAAGLIARSPGFDKRFRVFEGYRRIVSHATGGLLQVKAADDRTGDGAIPSLGILDEIHRHRDLKLYRTWRGKLGKRGGQLLGISTAGEAGTEFEEVRARMLTEAAEVTVDGFHTRAASADAVIHDWSVPADADVEDMGVVKRANPLSTVTAAELGRKRASPAMTAAHWRRFVCNQVVRGDFSAVGEAEWAAAASDDPIPEGVPVYAGLDVGWKWDTTAVVPVWVPGLEDRRIGVPEVLVPPRDGRSMSPQLIHDALRRVHARNPIEALVVDGAVGGEVLAEWAEENLGCRVVIHSNGHAAQCLAFERWMEGLREGTLQHPGDPTLTQHVLNARARILPDGRSRFDRPVSTRSAADLQDVRVIDALSAASGAHSVAVGDLRAEPEAVFDRPGLEVWG